MNQSKLAHERIRVGDRVSIVRRGKRGIYHADFWSCGQHRRKSLRTSNKKVALRRAIEIEHQLGRDEYELKPPPVKISAAIEKYLAYLKTESRARRTLTRYRGELKTFASFMARQGVVKLTGILPSLLDAFRAERMRNHAPRTVFHESVVIKQLLKWSLSRALLGRNPLADYKLVEPPRVIKRAPTLSQVHAILRHCSPAAQPAVTVLAFTGMRVGELQGLRRTDVDLRASIIHVRQQLDGPTKTKKVRKIPIHPRIDPILREQLASHTFALLFCAQPSRRYPGGGRPISTKRLGERFNAAVRRAGYAGFTPHSLRHCFNTTCINQRVPERVVRAWMGHADHSMTGLYFDLSDADSKNFMDSVSFEVGPRQERPPARGKKEMYDDCVVSDVDVPCGRPDRKGRARKGVRGAADARRPRAGGGRDRGSVRKESRPGQIRDKRGAQ